MTDDDAFIRIKLASPGDDMPRLVYADWLEERGDERSEYLHCTWHSTNSFIMNGAFDVLIGVREHFADNLRLIGLTN